LSSKSSPPSLRDIAEVAGVSVNTVSRALTGKPDVNAETRARVQALAQELGYMPNLLARSLLRGRSWLVGLVVTDCTNPFYAGLIRAAETTLSRKGYGVLLATSNEDSGKENRALTILQEHRVDGILLTAVDIGAEHVQRLLSGRTPVVLLGRRDPAYAGPFVGTDNVAGAERILRFLIGEGHTRIAHIARADGATSAGERLAGYRNGLTEAGIGYDGRMVFSAVPTLEGGETAANWLLGLSPAPTAVFAYNDSQAIGLMRALQDRGKRIPDDYSIVGFDDIQISRLISPGLTTVAQPVDEIGTRGAEMLVDFIDGNRAPAPMLLQPQLVKRQSAASISPRSAYSEGHAAIIPRRQKRAASAQAQTSTNRTARDVR
jgi:LacI family transcriptional regulator, galactose operon repressor